MEIQRCINTFPAFSLSPLCLQNQKHLQTPHLRQQSQEGAQQVLGAL